MGSFRDLVVWQKGLDLADLVYDASENFPKHELYGLASQLRRAAVSVPANIAEGHERATTRDYLRHVAYSRGSLAELQTLVEIAKRRNYVTGEQARLVTRSCQEIDKMLAAAQASLRAKLRSADQG
jgi:four helix bundle protein